VSIRRLFILAVAVTGFTAAAYAIGRRTRQLEKRQLKQDLRAWEDEGGNLAPSETPTVGPAVAAA